MIYLVREFFRVHDTQETAFELSALMSLEYTGDASKAVFKDQWDHMVRHLRTKLSDRGTQGIFLTKLRASEDLKGHLLYYDHCPDGLANKSYRWLSALLDQWIASEQKDNNISALTSAHLSKVRRATAPA